MIRSSLKFYNLAVNNRCGYLAVTRCYVPRRRQPQEVQEPGINRRLPYFKDDFLSNDDPEAIVSYFMLISPLNQIPSTIFARTRWNQTL